MKKNQARMLTAFMILSVYSGSHASMGDEIRLTGVLAKLGMSYARQPQNVMSDGENCASREESVVPFTALSPLKATDWKSSAGTTTLSTTRDTDRGVKVNTASHFQRIEILQYAQAWVTEVIPEVEIPSQARAAVIAMEARHRSFMQMGLNAQLLEYHLDGVADESDLAFERFNLSPCLDSSKRFMAKRVAQFRAMYQEAR